MRNILFSVLAMLSLSFSAQTDFYYQLDGSKTHLTILPNVQMIHFKNGVPLGGFVSEGYHYGGNYYILTGTEELSETYRNYNLSKAYVTGKDTIFESDEIVLQFKTATSEAQKTNLESQYHLTHITGNDIYERYDALDASLKAVAIYETGLVKYAHPNFFIRASPAYQPNDIYFDKQWYLHNTGQIVNDGVGGTLDADMDVAEAWDITRGDSNIVTAIIDWGVTSDHPDLPNSRQVRLPGGNLTAKYDTLLDPNNLSPSVHSHGDNCAGIIGATQDNLIGISGIAPFTKIMPIKLGFAMPITILSDVILFADSNNAQIMSLSFTWGSLPYASVETAIDLAFRNDRLIFAALGNNRGSNQYSLVSTFNIDSGMVEYPANSPTVGVIAVGASTINNQVALYSPISKNVDIVAPSSNSVSDAGYRFSSAANDINIWTTDYPDTNLMPGNSNPYGYTDSSVPIGEILPNYGSNNLAFTGRFGGTSAAAPMVAGVSALVLTVNNCLTNTQVKDILFSTADKSGGYNYNWSSAKSGHSKEFGYGKVNAHKAVLAAQAMQSSILDLVIKDVPNDFGAEPDTVANMLYVSEDIWTRNAQDGRINQYQEVPEYSPTHPVYIYVRVRNHSCVDATANDSISIYWAKASTALAWPAPWDASISSPLMGAPAATLSVGNLKAGRDTILEIPWLLPNPQNYAAITNDIWHFCLLARVESSTDTMTFPETAVLWQNVRNNNNIAWKNVTVVDNNKVGATTSELEYGLGTALAIGNNTNEEVDIKLKFRNPTEHYGLPISTAAEINIKLDEISLQKWEQGGYLSSGLDYYGDGLFRVVDETAVLEGLYYEAYETSTIYVGFNFLTELVDDKMVFHYYVEQFNSENQVVGGEEYYIHRDERPLFLADAGFNQRVNQGQTIQLQVNSINEPALYNWYDENGELFYTGTDTSFIPTKSQKFVLEILALKDGFKDYDDKEIDFKENFIQQISPNPMRKNQTLTINYVLNTGASVQFVLENIITNRNHIYPAQVSAPSASIAISNLTAGNYILKMLVDGIVLDSKSLIIQN